jgi:hypothetical protein
MEVTITKIELGFDWCLGASKRDGENSSISAREEIRVSKSDT